MKIPTDYRVGLEIKSQIWNADLRILEKKSLNRWDSLRPYRPTLFSKMADKDERVQIQADEFASLVAQLTSNLIPHVPTLMEDNSLSVECP